MKPAVTAALMLLAPVLAAQQPAVETVQFSTVVAEQVFDGTLEAVNQATVSAQTSGRILELPFDVNDFVDKGEVIVRFRDTEQRAQLNAARGNLQEAQARHVEAQAEFNRIKGIHERGLLSNADLDRARANLNAAKAKYDASAAALAQAEEQLEQTVVRAPYSGIVVARHVQVGELATVGKSLMTGLSLEHMRAVVNVPQAFIDAIRLRKQASVLLPAGKRIEAESLATFPYADERSHTFRVRVQLPAGQHGIYPGMLVKVAFAAGDRSLLTVPRAAVVQRGELTAVYVRAEGGRWNLRAIRVGNTVASDDRIEVLAGLSAGEEIALDPIAAGIALKQQAAPVTPTE